MSAGNYFYTIQKDISDTVFAHSGRCFLLLDPTLERYHADSQFYELLGEYNIFRIPFVYADLENALELWIVSLEMSNPKDWLLFEASIAHSMNELRPDNLNRGEGRTVCSWISTRLTLNELSEEIFGTAIQQIQSTGKFLLRFYDPSIFGLLFSILDNWQKNKLLKNINVWCYINGDGLPQSVNGEGGIFKKLNYSLELTDCEFIDINNIEKVNAILRRYRELTKTKGLTESQAVGLLYPALRYFAHNFSLEDTGYINFGVDILFSGDLFYTNTSFKKNNPIKLNHDLPVYKKYNISIKND